MRLHHLRNVTCLLTLGDHRLLVDPMLCDAGAMPPFELFGGPRRRNPLVELPPDADEALAAATGVLITHEHPDHLDPDGLRWVRQRGLPVWASRLDVPSLRSKGLDARVIDGGTLGVDVEVFPGRHGRGAFGWLMGPVSGFYLAHPREPSIYITGDTVLTDEIEQAVARLQPDVIVAPAGVANFGLGGDILFTVDELVDLVRAATGEVVFNHLEAVDHCPTTRGGLRRRMEAEGLGARVHIPEDGQELRFEGAADAARPELAGRDTREPGLQKWLTARLLSGT